MGKKIKKIAKIAGGIAFAAGGAIALNHYQKMKAQNEYMERVKWAYSQTTSPRYIPTSRAKYNFVYL